MKKNGVSVIICCHNSALRLPETLKHIALQKVPKNILWELIIVDNASTDDTNKVAQQEWHRNQTDIPFSIIKQDKIGLTYARLSGIMAANYTYCLFCDDDNWLSENYIKTAYCKIDGDHQIGVVGGYGVAVFEVAPPEWFENVKHSYAVGAQAPYSGDVTLTRGYVFGAGAVFRRSVLMELISTDNILFLTDRKGKKITSGGDKELCLNFILKGYKIYYLEELKFEHYIPKNRLTTSYYKKLRFSFVLARTVLSLYEYKINGKDYVLYRRFLWVRELFYFFRKEFLNKPQNIIFFFNTYTYALIKTYVPYHKTLNYLKKAEYHS